MTHDDREGAAFKGAPWPACWGWMENPREERRESVWVLDEKTTVHVGVWGCQKSLCKKSTYLPRYAGAKGQRTESQLEMLRHTEVFGGKESPRCLQEVPTKQRAPSTWMDIDPPAGGPTNTASNCREGCIPSYFLVCKCLYCRHSCVRSWLNSYHEGRVWRSHNAVSWVYTQTINS